MVKGHIQISKSLQHLKQNDDSIVHSTKLHLIYPQTSINQLFKIF